MIKGKLVGWIAASIIGVLVADSSYANYRAAQALLAKKRYMQAAPEFFKAYSYPTNRIERVNAEYGLARSLEGVGLNYSASYYYSLIVRKGTRNPYFKNALEALGRIDQKVNLGRAHVSQLLKKSINPAAVPGKARGFFFYYQGLEAFSDQKWNLASQNFTRVNSSSKYYAKAQFHLGVIASLRGQHSRAISLFEKAKRDGSRALRTQANLNIARVNYERKNFRRSFKYYAMVDRLSDYWLDTIFESSWAFFILKKHNNTLGNIHTIHSPFFDERFYPEAYILQAITFLRLCQYEQVKQSLVLFQKRYRPINKALNRLLDDYQGRPAPFYNMVNSYHRGSLNKFENVWSIINALARTDMFKEAKRTISAGDRELSKLGNAPNKWQQVGLYEELEAFLKNKKVASIRKSGRELLSAARGFKSYLRNLSNQTKFIQLERNMGKINKLREKLNVRQAEKDDVNFIGGLQELQVGQDLEYWPFQGEYWEDELGGYVYNVNSSCSSGAPKK